MMDLDISNTLFIISMIFLLVSNIFLRKYYKTLEVDRKKGKKLHIASIILYSIAVILFLMQVVYT